MKKKILTKKLVATTKKANTVGKDESSKMEDKKLKSTTNKIKAKSSTAKVKRNDDNSDNSSNDSDTERNSKSIMLKKLKKTIARKAVVVKTTDIDEMVVPKRMASLNASAMMAASYEVERHLDKCEEKMYKVNTDTEEHITPPPKIAKDIKNEVFEPNDVRIN